MSSTSDLFTYDRQYSLATNNLPYTATDNSRYTRYKEKFGLRNRFRGHRYNPLPTEDEIHPVEEETSFSNQPENPPDSVPVEDTVIDVEPSETTGLLEGLGSGVAGGAGAVGGVVGSVGSGAGSWGLGTTTAVVGGGLALGAGIAGGVASLFSSSSSSSKSTKNLPSDTGTKPGIVLPFSNNIGPGNTIQEPASLADAIAAEHDRAYSVSKTAADVYKADTKAIGDFAYEAIYGSNPVSQLQAGVGSVGLSVKHAAEKSLGKVLYGNYVFL